MKNINKLYIAKKQYHAPGVFQEAKTAVRWLQSEKINLGPYKVINWLGGINGPKAKFLLDAQLSGVGRFVDRLWSPSTTEEAW